MIQLQPNSFCGGCHRTLCCEWFWNIFARTTLASGDKTIGIGIAFRSLFSSKFDTIDTLIIALSLLYIPLCTAVLKST